MSTLSDAIKKHQPEPRKRQIDEWYEGLDVEDREAVDRIIVDPKWSTNALHRLLSELNVGIGNETLSQWRRTHGFNR